MADSHLCFSLLLSLSLSLCLFLSFSRSLSLSLSLSLFLSPSSSSSLYVYTVYIFLFRSAVRSPIQYFTHSPTNLSVRAPYPPVCLSVCLSLSLSVGLFPLSPSLSLSLSLCVPPLPARLTLSHGGIRFEWHAPGREIDAFGRPVPQNVSEAYEASPCPDYYLQVRAGAGAGAATGGVGARAWCQLQSLASCVHTLQPQ